MMIGRSRQLADQLDAVLDGRLEAVPDELAPLVAVAEELRTELGALELDPRTAEAHLNLVYRRGRTSRVRLPQLDLGWRRRAVSIALAASLIGLPASFASTRSLPGDPLYALKLGIEKVRLVAALSPGAEAGERTRVATVRLEELAGLLTAGEFGRVPDAIVDLQQAVLDAQQAIAVARRQGADSTTMAALETRLADLTNERDDTIKKVIAGLPPGPTKSSVIAAITSTSTTTTSSSSNTTQTTECKTTARGDPDKRCESGGGGGGSTTTTEATTTTTEPPTTTPEPPQTTSGPPPTNPPATEAPPTDPPEDNNGRGNGDGRSGDAVDDVGDTVGGLLP
jgi:hypothetical protein